MNKISIQLIIIIIIAITLITIISVHNKNEYVRIRSEVIQATGYDISYPKEWKGVCKW